MIKLIVTEVDTYEFEMDEDDEMIIRDYANTHDVPLLDAIQQLEATNEIAPISCDEYDYHCLERSFNYEQVIEEDN